MPAENQVMLFADDTKVFGEYNKSDLESDLCNISKCMEEVLPLNTEKAQLFNFKGDTEDTVYFEKEVTRNSKSAKHFDIWLKCDFETKEHLCSVTNECNIFISVLHHVRSQLNLKLLITIYKTVHTTLYLYGLLIYGMANKSYLSHYEDSKIFS